MLHVVYTTTTLLIKRVKEALPNGLQINRQKQITIGRDRRLFGKSQTDRSLYGSTFVRSSDYYGLSRIPFEIFGTLNACPS
jgi:hypothetical protein